MLINNGYIYASGGNGGDGKDGETPYGIRMTVLKWKDIETWDNGVYDGSDTSKKCKPEKYLYNRFWKKAGGTNSGAWVEDDCTLQSYFNTSNQQSFGDQGVVYQLPSPGYEGPNRFIRPFGDHPTEVDYNQLQYSEEIDVAIEAGKGGKGGEGACFLNGNVAQPGKFGTDHFASVPDSILSACFYPDTGLNIDLSVYDGKKGYNGGAAGQESEDHGAPGYAIMGINHFKLIGDPSHVIGEIR
jgi:hypothetical protein